MASTSVWAQFAAERGMRYFHEWAAMRGVFRGGGMHLGGVRQIFYGWSGIVGGLPCFGFRAWPGSDPGGHLYVAGLRLPGISFPDLSLSEADFLRDGPGIPIEREFDLHWTVRSSQPAFARDAVTEPMRRELTAARPEFSEIWFERDAILVSSRGEVSPESVDRSLALLRRIVDTIPSRVLDALRPRPFQPALPAYHQVRPQGPTGHALGRANEWGLWAARRGWLHYDNAREVVERFNHGPVPGGRFTDAFVGKFGALPTFGWRWASGVGAQVRVRHVICLRSPGLALEPVRVTREDALLSELVGSGDIEVGDAHFDAQWRVTSESSEQARALLRPAVWRCFSAPTVPSFGQLWFERDVVAVVTDGPLPPSAVDGYLTFLHSLISVVTQGRAPQVSS